MAILSNINGKFAVESSGAIQLSGSAGTSGYVLKSNGTGSAASWVDPTTIIGGPYLPLSGGTLTGATATASGISFTVGGTLTGTTATFSGNVTITSTGSGTFSIINTNASQTWGQYVGSNDDYVFRDFTDSRSTLVLHGDGNATFAGNISAPLVRANVLNNQANSANIIYRTGTTTVIGGGSSSNKLYVLDNGDVGVNESSPNAKFDVSGNVKLGSAAHSSWTDAKQDIGGVDIFVGSGSKAFQVWDDNQQSYPRFIVTRAGDVGIGTISPTAKLEIVGSNGTNIFRGNFAGSADIFMGFDTANPYLLLQDNSNVSTHLFQSNVNNYIVGSNVGIGNTNPQTNLQVTSTSTAKLRVNTTGVADSSVEIWGYDAGVHIGDNTNGNRWAIWNDGPGTSTSLKFGSYALGTWYADASQVMTMTSDGKVGIGTGSPADKLTISGGSVNIQVPAGSLKFNEGSTNAFAIESNGANGYLKIRDTYNSADRLYINNTGNVGIGVSIPSQSLEISGNMAIRDTHKIYFNHNTNTNRYIGASSTNDLDIAADDDINYRSNYNRFFNGGTEFARLSGSTNSWIGNGSNGQLGIGKTNPGFALDVNGGIASTGTTVSYATSPLSWQANGNTGTYTQTVIYSNQSNSSGIINNAAVFIERGRLTNSASGEIRHLIIGSRGGQSQFTFASEKLGINNDSPSAQLHLTANASNSVPFKLQGHNSTSVEQMLIYTGQSAGTGWYNIVAQAGGINQLIIYGNGNIQNANNSYGQISDERLKENIVDTTPKLEDIKKIKVKNFNFIGDDLKQIGMIAQEVEEVFPGLVEEIKQPDVEDVEGGTYKSIKYSVLVPILIKAIQELEARVKELENK